MYKKDYSKDELASSLILIMLVAIVATLVGVMPLKYTYLWLAFLFFLVGYVFSYKGDNVLKSPGFYAGYIQLVFFIFQLLR